MTTPSGLATPEIPHGLVYVSDTAPGIRRQRRGDGFTYRRPDGAALRDRAELERIRALAIPPAYSEVWICMLPHGHLQATGRDARGRKQYRYHAKWRLARDETKFDRMLDFGAALPRIRAAVERDLAAPVGERVVRETVIAAIVRLLDTTLMRVGNDEYARSNGSFGLTTLRNRHVKVAGDAITLRFRGKSGVDHAVSLQDRRVARIVKRCQSLPGQELFQFLDAAGNAHSVGSLEVNDYLRAASGGDFTAKDFRTWHGSVHALELWRALAPDEAAQPTLAGTKRLLEQVAARLGNTVSVCRKAYVHPRVLALLTGEVRPGAELKPLRRTGLSLPERHLLAWLKEVH
ncbi:MAG: DNA topoisomerase IB [Pseudomonadota bacterium]|nr:DNA topoisomerase IB [Pseudomonadota bacterium]